MHLARAMRYLRRRRGMTQQQWSDYAGVIQATVSAVERGHRVPTLATCVEWCRRVMVSEQELALVAQGYFQDIVDSLGLPLVVELHEEGTVVEVRDEDSES